MDPGAIGRKFLLQNSKSLIFNHVDKANNTQSIEVDTSAISTNDHTTLFLVTVCEWGTGKTYAALGTYRGKSEKQAPTIILDSIGDVSASFKNGTLKVSFKKVFSYVSIYY